MNVNRKTLTNVQSGSSHGDLKVLLIGGDQAEIVEIQTVLARLPGIVVEAIPTLARLSLSVQKGAAHPDLLLVDVNTDNPDDLAVFRDLKKVSGIEDVPVIALTDRSTAYAPLRAIRAGATDVLLKPIDTADANEVFGRVIDARKLRRQAGPSLGKAIVFMHLSGGAGATTLAVNSAVALARASSAKHSCLIDLDVQFGNAASLLDLPSTSPIQEFIDDPTRLDEAMLESMMLRHQTGLQVLTAPRSLIPLTAYGPEGVRNLIDLGKRHFNYVVVDLPVALAPWTDSVLRSATVIYLVTAVSVPSVHRTVKFFDLLHQEGADNLPIKVVANRHHRASKRGNEITVPQFEKATGRKVDYMIPNDYSLISLSHGQGRPAVRLKPNSPFTMALSEMLATDVSKDAVEQPKRSLFSFGRM